jgi:uncharacterized protein (TIGR02145 family)
MKNKFLIIIIVSVMATNSLIAQVIDKDGHVYSTIKIGKQEWLAENLDVSHFRNGDSITEVEDIGEWQKAGEDGKAAWCYYKNDSAFGATYHKLYNWYAVNDPRGLAPESWHIPTSLDWENLSDYLGGEDVAGGSLKTTSGWDDNGNGTNKSGFAALPGGYRSVNGAFSTIGEYGNWWSSSESTVSDAWYYYLYNNYASIYKHLINKENGLSVRCIKN